MKSKKKNSPIYYIENATLYSGPAHIYSINEYSRGETRLALVLGDSLDPILLPLTLRPLIVGAVLGTQPAKNPVANVKRKAQLESRPHSNTIWGRYKEYLNASLGQVLSRKEIITLFCHQNEEAQPSTIETYRLYLTEAGYLKRLRRGQYVLKKRLPKALTSVQAYAEAYYKS